MTTRTWANYAQELEAAGHSSNFATAAAQVKQHFLRLGVTEPPARVQAYLKRCGVNSLMYLQEGQMMSLADHLSRIQHKSELEQVAEPISEPEDLSDLMAEIDVNIARLNLVESSLVYQLALQVAGGHSRAVLEDSGLRLLLKMLKSCDRVF